MPGNTEIHVRTLTHQTNLDNTHLTLLEGLLSAKQALVEVYFSQISQASQSLPIKFTVQLLGIVVD